MDKLNKFLKYFLLLSPLLDLLTGVLVHNNVNLTIGIIIRCLYLGIIGVLTIFVYKKTNAIKVYLAVLLYMILYVFGIYKYKHFYNLFYETQQMLKVIYFPVLLYSMYQIKDKIHITLNDLYNVLITYILCIFIPTILGVGYETYKVTKQGYLGFYNSANEISGIVSILTPIMFIKFMDKKHLLLKGLFFIIYIITILNMGTKTPLLSLLITIFVFGIYLIYKTIKNKNYKLLATLAGIFIVLLTSVLIMLPRTNFYKNIRVHLDYLGVDNIGEVFTELNLVDHFIFSQRLTFASDEYDLYKNSNMYQKVFGRGYLDNGYETKFVEMDYFDIFFHQGIIGFILVFTIYGYVLFKVFKEKNKSNLNMLFIYTSLFLIIILSLFSGHIIIAPSVNLIVVYLILMISKKEALLN